MDIKEDIFLDTVCVPNAICFSLFSQKIRFWYVAWLVIIHDFNVNEFK